MKHLPIIGTILSILFGLLAFLFRKNAKRTNILGFLSVVSAAVGFLPTLFNLLGFGKKNLYQTLLAHGFKETFVSSTEVTLIKHFPSVVKDANDQKILDLLDKLNKVSSPRIISVSQSLNVSGVVDYIIVLPIGEKTSKGFID